MTVRELRDILNSTPEEELACEFVVKLGDEYFSSGEAELYRAFTEECPAEEEQWVLDLHITTRTTASVGRTESSTKPSTPSRRVADKPTTMLPPLYTFFLQHLRDGEWEGAIAGANQLRDYHMSHHNRTRSTRWRCVQEALMEALTEGRPSTHSGPQSDSDVLSWSDV
jgi:hypothetical protein